jgi:hypothetical protein
MTKTSMYRNCNNLAETNHGQKESFYEKRNQVTSLSFLCAEGKTTMVLWMFDLKALSILEIRMEMILEQTTSF